MRALPVSIRTRLTALYAGLFLVAGAVLLGVSYWLVARHFERTLPDEAAASALADLRGQYLLALAGTTLVSVALGWIVAGRVLRPLSEITATARRVSQDRLEDERLALEGPHDELRELADTFDAMLDRLAAAFASQRRFVANASHELRTPLTVLRAEVEVTLADPDAGVTELRAMGETVRDAVVECEALLDGLLLLARSHAGVDRREPVDLAQLARRAAGRAHGAVELTVSAPEPVTVAGDAALLARMVANLVENAVRHNVPGGWATVDVHVRAGGAELVVANSGAPVPVAAAGRLLEPFQRLARRGEGPPGVGLGLSIVRSVAEAHGGTVELEPRPGGGLRVTVRLPATWPAATSVPDAAAAVDRRVADTRPVAAARS
ncbi:MAG: HAMP domain-containing sensor histidine kinase [Solirubrobacteraceae bacterium]